METTFIVTAERNGITIKKFFELEGYSTARIKRLKYSEEGGIYVNGTRQRVRCVLKTGDVLVLNSPEKQLCPKDASVAAKVVYEDKFLYVAEKPQGVASHPDRVHDSETFGHMLAAHFGKGFALHIITRLDLVTSGLVLGALDEVTAQKLNQMQICHEIAKTYYAITENPPQPPSGKIDFPLALGDGRTVVSPTGKPSVTLYEAVASSELGTLVKLTPQTGRTHQLRAHLAEIGCPIKGDVRYGAMPANRVYLHMAELTFTHPMTGETITVTSKLPFEIEQ